MNKASTAPFHSVGSVATVIGPDRDGLLGAAEGVQKDTKTVKNRENYDYLMFSRPKVHL